MMRALLLSTLISVPGLALADRVLAIGGSVTPTRPRLWRCPMSVISARCPPRACCR